MRISNLFGETLRAAPGDVELVSHQLLLRAGYVRQLAAGIFSYLPVGLRSMRKIEQIIREEMDAIGGQEITMPVAQPAEIWQETGRWYEIDAEMARFKDRTGRDMVLGMTHEEIVADLVRRDIHSYRQLPCLVYQIQTKFRDDPRPRAGLIRVREFTMKDSYSLDLDFAGLEEQYRRHYTAYFRIFSRAGLRDVISVQSDTGMMGGKLAHEFMFLSPIGEDTLVLCDGCGASANRQVASFRKPDPPAEELKPLEKVATPACKTIAELAAFLGIPESKTAKVVFFAAEVSATREIGERRKEKGDPDPDRPNAQAPEPRTLNPEPSASREVLVMALVRGDMEVNETKLTNALKARWLVPATAEAIAAVGAVAGYASPIGIRRENVIVLVDELVASSPNLVSGANEEGFHFLNANAGRDYEADVVTDLTAATDGAPCAECGAPLRLSRGVEVGNIFQLGTRYTEALGALYSDADGQQQPVVMGSYGIGVGRLLACAAEAYHDDKGLTLPISVSPYAIYFIRMAANDPDLEAQADSLYDAMLAAGIDVLYDDREVSAGVKFADADLLGIPLRVTLSSRSVKNGGVEMKRRAAGAEPVIVPLEGALEAVRAEIAALQAEAAAGVISPEYPG